MKTSTLLVLIMLFVMLIPMAAYGEDYYGLEDRNDESELAEDAGELLGWVAVALTIIPVALYPARKILPAAMRKKKESKKKLVSLLSVIKKLHEPVGIMLLLLAALHGLLLVWSEGEFGTDEWIGTISLLFAVIGGIFGASFAKKRKVKVLKYTHVGLLITAVLIGGIHILLA